jgi:diketogulonate reductase-like aldo/keto reductase
LKVFITSKLNFSAHHPDEVQKDVRQTLAELRIPYLDLYLVHSRTSARVRVFVLLFVDAAAVSIEFRDGKAQRRQHNGFGLQDTWRAMESLVEQGLVKEIGKSLRSAAHKTRREQLQCANVE